MYVPTYFNVKQLGVLLTQTFCMIRRIVMTYVGILQRGYIVFFVRMELHLHTLNKFLCLRMLMQINKQTLAGTKHSAALTVTVLLAGQHRNSVSIGGRLNTRSLLHKFQTATRAHTACDSVGLASYFLRIRQSHLHVVQSLREV